MRQPESLTPLVDMGIIQEVLRPLMSGKEAQVYLVTSGGEQRVAKVYKTAQNRTFRQRTEYTEGRGVRNTRTQRAKNRRSRYGRAQDEASWRAAEVDIIYRLRAAGVRVPEPHYFVDGVLVMELITDAHGDPAPRLADVALGRVEAGEVFSTLLASVVKMLHAGVVHGDLSEFNVLMGPDGPVVIDFPQSVDPAKNQSARKLLLRDVENLNQFLVRYVPGKRRLPYGPELWDLYARGELTPDTELTGVHRRSKIKADTMAVLYEIEAAARDAEKRRDAAGPLARRKRRKSRVPNPPAVPVAPQPQRPAPAVELAVEPAVPEPVTANTAEPSAAAGNRAPAGRGGRPDAPTNQAPPTKRRRRRRKRRRRSTEATATPESTKAESTKAAPTKAARTAASRTAASRTAKPGAGRGDRPVPQTNESPPPARRRRRRRRRRRASGAAPKDA